MLQPIDAFKLSIEKWEGLYQDDPADSGNIKLASGLVVGTMRGVTPGAWAQFLNRPVRDITPQMMKAISLTDAARVYEQNYYRGPGFNRFDWGPTIDVAADIGWGSGPVRGIKALQLLAGGNPDGVVGPKTVAAHRDWVGSLGPARAVSTLYNWRVEWYKQICVVRPANNKFLKGWLNRAKWQSPSTGGQWWQAWSAASSIPTPQPEPVPSAPERQAIESIPERDLDAMASAALEALLLVDPTLARALNVLRGLFG